MKMKLCVFRVICLLFSQGSCFDNVCPHVSQAKLRANICKDSSKYMCFREININTNMEFCKKTDEIQQEGLKTVVRGSFDGVPCDKNHYQPFKYSSVNGDSCVFLKSVCNDKGQIETTEGRTTSDRTCRCDYRFGYSFVSPTNNPCVCVPSEEDCSCFYKECDKDEVLTPDYLCMHPANITAHFNMFTCPLIEESMSTKTENTKVKKGSGEITKDICPRQKEQNALIVVLTCVVEIQFDIWMIYWLSIMTAPVCTLTRFNPTELSLNEDYYNNEDCPFLDLDIYIFNGENNTEINDKRDDL